MSDLLKAVKDEYKRRPFRALSTSNSHDFGPLFKDVLEPGTYECQLIAKAWGKASCLHCYFSVNGTAQKVRLTCWKDHGPNDGKYKSVESAIDFSEPGIEGQFYRISVKIGKTGHMRFMSAEKI